MFSETKWFQNWNISYEVTFFSGFLFDYFIDGWLFLHNWVEGPIFFTSIFTACLSMD